MIDITSMSYALTWYVTIFAELPHGLMVRIYDIMLYEGVKILFRVAMALLSIFKKKLLQSDWEDAILLLKTLSTSDETKDTDGIISTAMKLNITNKQILQF